MAHTGRFCKQVTQQSSILHLFPSVLETTMWTLKSQRQTQRLFNALSETVTRHWPSENRGGLDTGASDYQGIWRVQVSWLSHRNEPDCTGEWETENWHGWKEMLIYWFFFFPRYMFTGFDIGLFHLLSTTQTQASQVVLTVSLFCKSLDSTGRIAAGTPSPTVHGHGHMYCKNRCEKHAHVLTLSAAGFGSCSLLVQRTVDLWVYP